MRAGWGFTLVELLIATAIVAVLLAVIMPTAGAARSAAHRAHCSVRLHEIGIAMTGYMVRHGGFHPPYGSSTFNRSQGYYLSDGKGAVEDWTGLWLDGQVGVPMAFFCPATQAAAHQFNTSQNPWPADKCRTGYCRRYFTDISGVPHISALSPGRAVAADLVGSAGQLEAQHADGINVLYSDSSVEFRSDFAALLAVAGISGSRTGSNAQLDSVWLALDRTMKP